MTFSITNTELVFKRGFGLPEILGVECEGVLFRTSSASQQRRLSEPKAPKAVPCLWLTFSLPE
jgi:hypothetical protein